MRRVLLLPAILGVSLASGAAFADRPHEARPTMVREHVDRQMPRFERPDRAVERIRPGNDDVRIVRHRDFSSQHRVQPTRTSHPARVAQPHGFKQVTLTAQSRMRCAEFDTACMSQGSSAGVKSDGKASGQPTIRDAVYAKKMTALLKAWMAKALKLEGK